MQVRGTSAYTPVKTRAERAGTIAIVAALHAGAITALVLGLHVTFDKKFIPDVVTRILPEQPAKPRDPPPPHLTLDRPQPPTAPEPKIDIKKEPGPTALKTASTGPSGQFFTSTQVAAITETHSKPPYPPMARWLGHQGVVRLKLTISPLGIITVADIEDSSGYAELDRIATEWVKTHWRYRPATVEGHPVTSTAEAAIRFNLNDTN